MNPIYKIRVCDNCTSSTSLAFYLQTELENKDLHKFVLSKLPWESDLDDYYSSSYGKNSVLRSKQEMHSITVELHTP